MINGKSLQWYDYGARFYDPQIGRFHSPDPLAHFAPGITPYHYCLNNPIHFTDPTGMWTETADSYTTSDAGEIADFLNRMGNGQNNSNTDNVNAGETNTTTIQTNFTDWNKGTVKSQLVEFKGLTTRRTQEANIYNNNTYDSTH